ncbi:MAG: M14 family zinc carboxypeptidase [Pseudobdellovibrio sp.]
MMKNKLKLGLILLVTSALGYATMATSTHLNLVTNVEGKGIRYTIKVAAKSAFDMGRYSVWLQKHGYDVAGYSWRKGEIEVITDKAGIEKLNQSQFQGFIKNMESGMATTAVDSRYLNPNKVEQKLKDLNAKYPQFTRLEQIGTSVQGRAIWALLISTTPKADDPAGLSKPSIIFDGMHHAREIMTSEIVMDVAENTLDMLAQNNGLAPLLNRWSVWVVPMLNVDGNNIVWTQQNMWRKNAHTEGSQTFGVDINRNYPFNWNRCNGASNSKGADDYRGAAGASEPETQAMMKLATEVRPTGSLSYHSYSELVLYPYGCNGVVTGDNALISGVANELAAILPSDSGSGNYDPGTPWQLLYDVDGDSMSYMYGEFGALALTFEVNQTFQPSYDVKAPTVAKHRKAWNYFLNRMDQNMFTLKVVDARTDQAVSAQIGISNIQLAQGEKPYRTNAGGYYFKVLNPGTYTISVQLADGRAQNLEVKMNGQPVNQTVVIQ